MVDGSEGQPVEGYQAGGAPLGNTRSIASGLARKRRWKLQEVVRKILPKSRTALCMRFGQHERKVEIWHRPEGQAFYRGLMACGCVWTCPVCAAKITERRRLEVIAAMKVWSGSVFMVTFTMQHSSDKSLKELKDRIKKALRKLKSGRWYQNFISKWGVKHSISGFEITVSKAAGWHPHFHEYFLSRLPADELDQAEMEKELSQRFIYIMDSLGGYVSAIYGVKVEKPIEAQAEGDEALKAYVSKWGLEEELTKSPVKMGRIIDGIPHYSPFQLLELAGDGDKWAVDKFKEYSEAMKGTHQLQWSRGLRAELKLAIEEKTDEQLVEDQVETGDELVYQLGYVEWQTILKTSSRVELLEAGEAGGVEAIKAFIAAKQKEVDDLFYSIHPELRT